MNKKMYFLFRLRNQSFCKFTLIELLVMIAIITTQ